MVATVGADDLALPLDHGGAAPVADVFHSDAPASPDAGAGLIMDALLWSGCQVCLAGAG